MSKDNDVLTNSMRESLAENPDLLAGVARKIRKERRQRITRPTEKESAERWYSRYRRTEEMVQSLHQQRIAEMADQREFAEKQLSFDL